MDNLTLVLSILGTFLGVLVAIKTLFGKQIDKLIEGKKNTKKQEEEFKKGTQEFIKAVTKDSASLTAALQELQTLVAKGAAYDKMFLEDRDKMREYLTRSEVRETMLLNMQGALLSLTRDKLLYLAKRYKEQGYITMSEVETLNGLFAAYEKLGGNGTIATIVKQVLQLEIVPDKK